MSSPKPDAARVSLERNGPVATVTLSNPPLNVLSDALRRSLYQTLEALRLDRSVRVAIFRGAGERAFSVGSDVREFPLDLGPHGGREKALFEQRMYNVLAALPQVTIAQMSGHTLGGGLEVALACDLRIAAENAQIGFPEIKLGVFPCSGGTQRLLKLVGPAKAKELMFFGDPIPAAVAERLGIVNRVVGPADLASATSEWATQLANRSQPALLAIKAAINGGAELGLAAGQALEAELFADLFTGDDLREGVQAFLEKRQPRWQHR